MKEFQDTLKLPGIYHLKSNFQLISQNHSPIMTYIQTSTLQESVLIEGKTPVHNRLREKVGQTQRGKVKFLVADRDCFACMEQKVEYKRLNQIQVSFSSEHLGLYGGSIMPSRTQTPSVFFYFSRIHMGQGRGPTSSLSPLFQTRRRRKKGRKKRKGTTQVSRKQDFPVTAQKTPQQIPKQPHTTLTPTLPPKQLPERYRVMCLFSKAGHAAIPNKLTFW